MRITVPDISDSDLETQIAIMNVDNPIRITKTKVNGLWTIVGEFPDTTVAPADLAKENEATSPDLPSETIAKPIASTPVKQPVDSTDSEATMQKIEWQQLKKAFPAAADDHLQEISDELNRDLVKYGLDTRLRRAHFFAQVREEGGPELTGHVESLNYSPEALKQFSYYKNHPDEAKTDGYAKDANGHIIRHANEEAIANKAYGRAELGNGGPSTGDGWHYRGRGFMQVTGKANYTSLNDTYKKYYANDPAQDFVVHPDLLGQFPYDIRSAVCFWNSHGLPKLADAGSKPAHVDAITAVVNKNTPSYDKRKENFAAIFPLLT